MTTLNNAYINALLADAAYVDLVMAIQRNEVSFNLFL